MVSGSALANFVFALFFGSLFTVVAKHLRIPAIVPLLIAGIVLGPEVLGLINTDALGNGLNIIISLSVGIILFEGGLTLDPDGYKKTSRVIWKLLSIAVVITWLGTALIVRYLFDYSWEISLLAGSLIIVTGPTVISPLLKRISVNRKLSHILHWEGVLNDPIGVFVAVLCFEWISVDGHVMVPFGAFALRLAVGIVVGLIGGKLIEYVLLRDWVEEEQTNVFVLAAALLLFGLSDFIVHEAGILTVVIAGLVLGWERNTSQRLKQLVTFKSELTEMSIGLLFILLAANLELKNFVELGLAGVLLMLFVMFVIRPLGIFASTTNSDLNLREKLFLSWIAPRGVVAGSMASLFAFRLGELNFTEAPFLEAFTFTVIGVTIVLQGLSGGFVARLLGVREEKRGWLIVGSHEFSWQIARYLERKAGANCIIVDTNPDAVVAARKNGLTAIHGNALTEDFVDEEWFPGVANLLALTDNRDLNTVICDHWADYLDKHRLFRWSGIDDEMSDKGIAIWQSMSKPSEISQALLRKEMVLVEKDLADLDDFAEDEWMPLATVAKDEVIVTGAGLEAPPSGNLLLLHERVHHLPWYVQPDHVLSLEPADFRTVLSKALKPVCDGNPAINCAELLEDLLDREDSIPTILRNGVAVPHCRCTDIDEPVCVILRIQGGIDLNSHDGDLSRLFFVLVSAESKPEMHLLLLSEVAKIASDEVLVQEIVAAAGGEEVLVLLRSVLASGVGPAHSIRR